MGETDTVLLRFVAETVAILYGSGGMPENGQLPADSLWFLAMDAATEIEGLRAWKAEATAVLSEWDDALSEWDDVWQAAGSPGPLGTSTAVAVNELLQALRRKAERTKIEGWIVLIYEHGQPTVNWDSTVHPNREVAEAEARAAGRQGWAADVAALQVRDPYGDEHEKRRIHWRDLGVPKTDEEGSRP